MRQAIDLIDEAAAKLKMEITSKPQALDEIDRKVRIVPALYLHGQASCIRVYHIVYDRDGDTNYLCLRLPARG